MQRQTLNWNSIRRATDWLIEAHGRLVASQTSDKDKKNITNKQTKHKTNMKTNMKQNKTRPTKCSAAEQGTTTWYNHFIVPLRLIDNGFAGAAKDLFAANLIWFCSIPMHRGRNRHNHYLHYTRCYMVVLVYPSLPPPSSS